MPDFADDTSSELERKVKTLKVAAVLETCSYLLLFYFWAIAGNDIGTKLTGAIHGQFFLLFAAMVFGVRKPMRWSWEFFAVAVLTGPIGAIVVWERIRREGVPEELRAPLAVRRPADA
jgi:integral membrane protein